MMIGYYLTPFIAPDDNQILASLSAEISREDNKNAVAYAPHQFQVWQLGEIDDEGNLTARKELLCDCSSLIRPRRTTTESQSGEAQGARHSGRKTLTGNGSDTGTGAETVPKSAQTNDHAHETKHQ